MIASKLAADSCKCRRRQGRTLAALAALLTAGLGLAACRQDMHDQPKVKPLAASAFFADGQGSRPLPAGTVARGFLRQDRRYWTGKEADGQPVGTLPVRLSRELLKRGRERYEIFCSPCHDRLGSGRGMVVRRGFKQPASFHIERLRQAPVGYFFDVITSGFGAMASHASQIPAADRWAIAAYIRVLQLSQHAGPRELAVEDRAALAAVSEPAAAPEAAAAAPPGGH